MLGVHSSCVVGRDGKEWGVEGGRVSVEKVSSFAFDLTAYTHSASHIDLTIKVTGRSHTVF